MIVQTFSQSLSPGNEQRNFWGSNAANTNGSRNLIGIKNYAIDSLIEKGEIKIPDLLKIDIEGAELKALEGMKNTLFKYHPTIFLSTHNCHLEGIHKKCCDFLKTLNYEI